MPSLTIRTGNRSGEVFAFDHTVVIGRGTTTDLVLDDTTVSRRHAQFTWADGKCVVTDLRTGNGTFLNSRRITSPTLLADGDELWLGRVVLRYASGRTADERDAEAPSVALVDSDGPPAPIMMAVDPQARPAPNADPARVIATLNRRIEALNELGADLAGTFDEPVLLRKVMERLFELLPQAERGMLLLQGEDGELLPKIARTRGGEATQIAASRTLIRQVISLRKGVLSVDTHGDARLRDVDSLLAVGVRTLVCVPMLAYDQVYGVIQIDSTRAAVPFDEADVALAFAMACQLAMGVANARMHGQLVAQRLFERDLVLARKIQRRFLPRRPPQLPGLCFSVEYAPALAVGGDFYDFLELTDGQLGVAIGDVSGKGVSAALYVAKLGSELRYAALGQSEPAEILARVNDALATDNDDAMFVTLLLAAFDPASGELKVANAGHLTPLVRRAGGVVELLDAPAQSPLGIREHARFEQTGQRLDRRDVLVLYSDGVTEATSRSRALFGDERLLRAVAGAEGTAPDVCAGIVSAVRAFLDGEPQNDDITVVTFGAEH